MESLSDQIVLINDDTYSDHLCFVCGKDSGIVGQKIINACTSFMNIPLSNKLGTIVGDEFCVVISKLDEICGRCFNLIDEVDLMEDKINILKKQVTDLLESKYNISVNCSDNQKYKSEKEDSSTTFCESSNEDFFDSYIANVPSPEVIVSEVCMDGNEDASQSQSFSPSLFCEPCSVFYESEQTYKNHLFENHGSEKSIVDSVVLNNSDFKVKKSDSVNEKSDENTNMCKLVSRNENNDNKTVCRVFICNICTNAFMSEKEVENHLIDEGCKTFISGNVDDSKEVLNEDIVEKVNNIAIIPSNSPNVSDQKNEGFENIAITPSTTSKACGGNLETLNNITIVPSKFSESSCGTKEEKILNITIIPKETSQTPSDSSKLYTVFYRCPKCSFQDTDKHVVKMHSDSHSSTKKTFACDICGMPFVSSAPLSRHRQAHDKKEGPVSCHICGKQCHDNLHALYHRRNEHNITTDLECGICNLPMESRYDLKNHILLNHRGKKEFKCGDCGKTFSRSVQYENHKLYSHGNNLCRICKKYIDDPVKLRQHEHRHARTDMKKFECDVCSRVFKTPSGLRVHRVSHTGKYKFFCEFCGRGFMSSVILQEHQGVHTREERYICDICGRKFVLYSTFHLHKQWHNNPYPFPCRVCNRKFRYRSERSNHVRRDHTGELPHKCPHCSAAFIKSSSLKKHLTNHTKKYPFNCDICSRGFDRRRVLAKHLAKVHNDSTLLDSIPITCEYKVALRPDEYPPVLQ